MKVWLKHIFEPDYILNLGSGLRFNIFICCSWYSAGLIKIQIKLNWNLVFGAAQWQSYSDVLIHHRNTQIKMRFYQKKKKKVLTFSETKMFSSRHFTELDCFMQQCSGHFLLTRSILMLINQTNNGRFCRCKSGDPPQTLSHVSWSVQRRLNGNESFLHLTPTRCQTS